MKFTIFSGCYNSAEFIDRLFTSVLSQTHKDFEWYIFDDHSKDNTVELIEQFINEHPEIDVHFTKNKPNKGLLFGYLETLQLAKGKYLVQWDHDDIHKPQELEVFNKTIEKYEDGNLAGVWALCEDQNGNVLGNKFPEDESVGNYFTHFVKYITVYGNNVQFNERMPCININKMRELDKYIRYNYSEDYELLYPTFRWAFLSMLGNKIVFVNQAVRTYYINQSHISMSRTKSKVGSQRLVRTNRYWINMFFKHLKKGSIQYKFSIYKSYVYHGVISDCTLKKLTEKIDRFTSKIIISFLYILVKLIYGRQNFAH